MKKKNILANVLLIVLSSIIALLLCEMLLRTTRFLDKNFKSIFTGIDSIVIPHDNPLVGYALTPNFFDRMQAEYYNPIVYKINSLGLRGDEAIEEPHRKIVIVGDSMSFGLGINNKEVFAVKLEQNLNAQSTRQKMPWQIYNCSVPGFNAEQEYYFCQNIINRLQPEIILWQLFYNDLYSPMRYALGNLIWDFEQTFPSHLLFLVNVFLHRNKIAPFIGPLGFEKMTHQMSRLAKKNNAKLISFILPSAKHLHRLEVENLSTKSQPPNYLKDVVSLHNRTPDLSSSELHDIEIYYLKKAGIDYLDMFKPFYGMPASFFKLRENDDHLNHLGHQVIAKALTIRLLPYISN